MTSKGFCTRGLLLFLIYTDLLTSVTSYSVSDVNNLLDKLFNQSTYNNLVPPDKQVNVFARYKLQSVNSLDIKKQIFSTTGFFTLKWQDDRLKWSTGYGDIKDILVPVDRVWHPDLMVLNSVNELQNNLGADRRVRIYQDGKLMWKPTAILSTICLTAVYFFPFDSQQCNLELTSIEYPSSTVMFNFLETAVDIGSHTSQTDWLVKSTFNYSSFLLEMENPSWSDYKKFSSTLIFSMTLKRQPGHYIMIVIFPTILTAVLTYVAFFLPLKSGTRIGYIVTVVLAYVVLLTLFADTMPSSSQLPSVLVVLFTITLGMAFFLIIITIFVTRLYNLPKRNIAPNWMHSLVRKCRKLKCKLKCRARRAHCLKQNQPIDDGRPTEEADSVEKSTPLKPFSNKELAEFFDYLLFIVFTVLYIFVLAVVPIGAAVWYGIASGKYK